MMINNILLNSVVKYYYIIIYRRIIYARNYHKENIKRDMGVCGIHGFQRIENYFGRKWSQ